MVIRDDYHFNGKNYVVIADSQSSYAETRNNSVNWAVEYDDYVKPPTPKSDWWVAGMIGRFPVD